MSTAPSTDPANIERLQREVISLSEQLEARSRSEVQAQLLTRLVFSISKALAERSSLRLMLNSCCETVVKELGAAFARVWTVNADGDMLELQASAGLDTHLDGPHNRVPVGELGVGRIALSRQPHLTNDIRHDPEVNDRAWATRYGMIAFAGHPLVLGDRLLGVIAVFSRATFDENTLLVLASVAALTAQAIDREWLKDDRARLLDKTERALKAAERSNEALQRFAGVASHDLQEPLRQITAFSQMMAELYRDQIPSEAVQYLDFIVDGAVRMGRLINGLLSYAQIEAMDSTPLETSDAELALASALESLRLASQQGGAVISHDKLPTLHGNQGLLTQLFQNLIGNAIKYRRDAEPRIHVSAVRQDREWIFSISDNGLGIEPEDRTRIFGVFIRLHGREISGAGLGLAFCSKIVELHHGRIWVEANPTATGSVFFFALPA
jgi:signal transduction histidine kinase